MFVRLALVVAVVLAAAACSSSSEFAVEFSDTRMTAAEASLTENGCTQTDTTPPCIGWTFAATGEAVDEAVFCPEGVIWWLGNETPDGDPLPDDQIEALVEAGEIFPIVTAHEYECADGSGAFGLKATINFDPAILEMSSGTWSIESGSGSLENLTGSGDITSGGGDSGTFTGTVSSG